MTDGVIDRSDAADGASIARRGMALSTVREGPTDVRTWEIRGDDHTILVWRRGTAKSKEAFADDGRGQRLSVRPSAVWVVPSGSRSLAAIEQASAIEFHQISIDPSLVGSGGLRSVIAQGDPVLHGLLDRISSTVGRDDTVAALLRDTLFDAVRLHVLDAYGIRRGPGRQERRTLDRATTRRLTEFLHDALDREISLEAMAEMSDMSVRRFRQSFATEYGTTPYQYLLDLRVERAKNLLVTTSLSIREIGTLVGFNRPSHFAATFKSRVGVSPTRFRADHA